MEKIKQYYKLCAIVAPADKTEQFYKKIDKDTQKSIFTQKHIDVYSVNNIIGSAQRVSHSFAYGSKNKIIIVD